MKTKASISSELESKLKNCDSEIQTFVSALQFELSKLHKKNIQLEAKNVSLDARVNVLEEELEGYNKSKQFGEDLKNFSDDDLKAISDIFKKYK